MSAVRIVVVGVGLVSPLAGDAPGTFTRLLRGDRGFRPPTLFDPSALKADLAMLEGTGGTQIKGLLTYSGISAHTASEVGANGNTFMANDVALMESKLPDAVPTPTAWLMRKTMYAALMTRRADAAEADDGAGPFGKLARGTQAIRFDGVRGRVEQARGFPWMRRDHDGTRGAAQHGEIAGDEVQRIGVEDGGHVGREDFADALLRDRVLTETGTDHDRVEPLEHRGQLRIVERHDRIRRFERAVGGERDEPRAAA